MSKSNERGFILLFVILITSILLLMGFSAIVLSHDDYEMKLIRSTVKKNFYIAEAATKEADMLIHEHIEDSVSLAYETVLDLELDERLKRQEFKEIYASQIDLLESKLEDISSYKLKNRENKEFTMDIKITKTINEPQLETENSVDEFNLELLAVCDESGVRQSIKVKYQIIGAEYGNYKSSEDLVMIKSWMNNKW